MDVVLIGLAPLNLTFKWIWPEGIQFRLWVLCRAHHRILTDIMGFPAQSVGILPRYEFFPPKNRLQKINFPVGHGQDFDLVYSGRISSHKNFSLVCAVASQIQHLSSAKIRFCICGAELEKQKKRIEKELKNHPWKIKPVLHGDLGTRWFRLRWKNPVLISLSTFCYEDFAVSVAQADQNGWPLFLSAWGAHLDVKSPRARWVPFAWIPRNQNRKNKAAAAKKIARYFFQQKSPDQNRKLEKTKKPKPVDRKTILSTVDKIHPKQKLAIEEYFDLAKEHSYLKSNRYRRRLDQAMSDSFID